MGGQHYRLFRSLRKRSWVFELPGGESQIEPVTVQSNVAGGYQIKVKISNTAAPVISAAPVQTSTPNTGATLHPFPTPTVVPTVDRPTICKSKIAALIAAGAIEVKVIDFNGVEFDVV
jgi:hypothetical protein